MKKAHDQNIFKRSFEVGQKVLLYNSHLHLFPYKLKSRWTGPFIVHAIFTHEAIEIEDPKNGNTLKVNSQRLKSFLELEILKIEEMPLANRISSNLSSIVESLAEDGKLIACGRHPSFLLFLVFVFLFCFVCVCVCVLLLLRISR